MKYIEKFKTFLDKKYGITYNTLLYIKIFSAPWLALLISKILSGKNLTLTIFTLIFFLLIILMDLLIDKHSQEGMLNKISDSVLIVFLLIPFGLNLFTFSIILAESILAFTSIYSQNDKKELNYKEITKKILQLLLIPVLILQVVTNFIPEMVVYLYIIIVIGFTYFSIFSQHFYFKEE